MQGPSPKTATTDDETLDPCAPTRMQSDVPAQRRCLRCTTEFWSDGFGERVCKRCKSTAAWKSSAPADAGHSRRR